MNNNFSKYYFIGIGGIGMSAIARYFNSKGYQVGGYDRTQSKLTNSLSAEGIEITFDQNTDNIPKQFLNNRETLIIITPAIPSNHPQLIHFKENGYVIMKRAEILGVITKKNKAICIAGTHGKTTTSTITAHIMYQSHVECNAFLGGISNNYNSNLLLSKQSSFVVVEADEYGRSFHQLNPYMAVITSIEPDHLDIYGTYDEVIKSFEYFASLISSGGVLLCNDKVSINPTLKNGVKKYSYGIEGKNDFKAVNIRREKNKIIFDFVAPTETIHDIELNIPITINIENSVAAIAMAWLNGVTNEEIRTAMSTFSGIYRRFDFILQTEKEVYIDDYAHHPGELVAGINSIKNLYPNRKITGIFQPHLYSRTENFAKEFAQSLSLLDELILLDIYPAREEPIEGVDSNLILKDVTIKNKTLTTKDNILKILENRDIDVLVTFGAGNIEEIVPKIKNLLKNRPKSHI